MATSSSKPDQGGDAGKAAAASDPATDTATDTAPAAAATRVAAVVQWPQASVYLGPDADDKVTLSSGRTADVTGGWVTLTRGEEVPESAGLEQAQHCVDIGAAAAVVVPA